VRIIVAGCLVAAAGLVVVATQGGSSSDRPQALGLTPSIDGAASPEVTSTTSGVASGAHADKTSAASTAVPVSAPVSVSSPKHQGSVSPKPGSPPVTRTGTVAGLAGLCLDDWARRTTNGNRVVVAECNGTSAQVWTLPSDGTLHVVGKCVDVPGGTPTVGSEVAIWDCSGAAVQVWRVGPGSTLINAASGLCLDVPGAVVSGTQLDVAVCTGGANQQWVLP
jgi:hypothetical protein